MYNTTFYSFRQLLRLHGVKAVFFGEDFVTVTKSSEEEEWALIKPDVFAVLMDYLQSGKDVITDTSALEPSDTSIFHKNFSKIILF